MRDEIHKLLPTLIAGQPPSHPGLAYERWAPPKEKKEPSGFGDDRDVGRWLEWIARHEAIPLGYEIAFARWKESLSGPETRLFRIQARGRLLIGHGNPTVTGVGLTLHHTWGVPLLPGPALKGLAAHYVQLTYGPDPERPEPDREPFRGVVAEGRRIRQGPGEVYRRLFGAPDTHGLGPRAGEEDRASQGEIIFHDALWIPAAGATLARDVLTVHHKTYYGQSGEAGGPNDHDDPNPVSFLTIRPGTCFLAAVALAPGERNGGAELLERARRYLANALGEWGLGGKTAAGYGRFDDLGDERVPVRRAGGPGARMIAEFESWLEGQKKDGVHQQKQLDAIETGWLERLLGLPGPAREEAVRLLRKYITSPKPRPAQRREQLIQSLTRKS